MWDRLYLCVKCRYRAYWWHFMRWTSSQMSKKINRLRTDGSLQHPYLTDSPPVRVLRHCRQILSLTSSSVCQDSAPSLLNCLPYPPVMMAFRHPIPICVLALTALMVHHHRCCLRNPGGVSETGSDDPILCFLFHCLPQSPVLKSLSHWKHKLPYNGRVATDFEE